MLLKNKRSKIIAGSSILLVVALLIFSIILLNIHNPEVISSNKSTSSDISELETLKVPREPEVGTAVSFKNVLTEDISAPGFSSVMVYRVSPVQIDQESINLLKDKLGIDSAGETINDITSYTGNSGAKILIQNLSGSISCVTDQNDGSESQPLDHIRENDFYLTKAKAWITEAGLYSEDYSKNHRVNPNGYIQDGNDNSVSQPTLMVAEFFHNDLNNIAISGVAPRIIVKMNAAGDVLSVTKIQNNYVPFKDYPMINIDQAIEKVRSGQALVYGISGDVDTIKIKSCKLVYYNRESSIMQNYLLPYYLMEATDSEKNDNISIAVRAVDDIYIDEE